MTLPKGFGVGKEYCNNPNCERTRKGIRHFNHEETDRKEKLKDIGNWALILTVPAGIVIIVIGYIMENFLMHLGIFISFVPFGISYYGFSWRERTKGDWGWLIALGIMLGIAIWFVVTY